jgi:hypothetical protein
VVRRDQQAPGANKKHEAARSGTGESADRSHPPAKPARRCSLAIGIIGVADARSIGLFEQPCAEGALYGLPTARNP